MPPAEPPRRMRRCRLDGAWRIIFVGRRQENVGSFALAPSGRVDQCNTGCAADATGWTNDTVRQSYEKREGCIVLTVQPVVSGAVRVEDRNQRLQCLHALRQRQRILQTAQRIEHVAVEIDRLHVPRVKCHRAPEQIFRPTLCRAAPAPEPAPYGRRQNSDPARSPAAPPSPPWERTPPRSGAWL